VKLFHRRWRVRTSLLASGALDAGEAAAVLAHVEGCASCRRDLDELRAVLELVGRDPVREPEPPIPLAALVTRVQARIDEQARVSQAPRRLVPGLALAGLGAAVLAGVLYRSQPQVVVPVPGPSSPSPSVAEAPVDASEEALDRLERTLARERAARYLAQAQDVLVNVASAPRNCVRAHHRVEMGEEAQRSRELLAERALLVDIEGAAVAGARPVLEDVEQVLREVATLPPCAHRRDLQVIHDEMERRHLLMKIDLMTRELVG
jgi:hypothetical protein